MNQARSERLIAALSAKGATKPCPRCGHGHFEVVAESVVQVQTDPRVISIGGTVVPTVVIGCKNCGYLTEHALGTLGMMPEVAHAG